MALSLVSKVFARKPLSAFDAEEAAEKLPRTLTLFDLICVGVGGTLGSGIFVLTGLIAHEYAGPGVVYSWTLAGVCTSFSAMAYAEMSSRISSSGSAYAYAYSSLGELPAFLAAWFMFLEYGISGAAIARSWGNKLGFWLASVGAESPLIARLETTYGVSVYAALLQLLCVLVLLCGVKVGRLVVNGFTVLKVLLVLFMTLGGLLLFRIDNLQDMAPLGVSGILRGSSAAFFGLLGYDEVCILASEARDPHRTLPLAVFGTVLISTALSVLASLALVGMQRWSSIDPENGFSDAFRARDWAFAQHLVSTGEVVTLPLVVLVSFLAQPRLQYVMACDGLLPAVFAKVDATGNLTSGILISGAFLTLVALLVPFAFLDDMISAGVLLSFSITNSALVACRRNGSLGLLLGFHLTSVAAAFTSSQLVHSVAGVLLLVVLLALAAAIAVRIDWVCAERPDPNPTRQFRMACVPYLPLLAVLLNYCMIGQLGLLGVASIASYSLVVVLVYLVFSIHYSVANNEGWGAQDASGGSYQCIDSWEEDFR